MEIIKLQAVYKNYVWGGKRLKEEYHKHSEYSSIAESWEVSVHPDGESIIMNGAYKGQTLSKYIEKKGAQVLGKKVTTLPVLIKFIDAKQALSIQVHPNDTYARKYEKDAGKNEMWYIVAAESDAYIYCGVKEAMTKQSFLSSIMDETLESKLKKVAVQAGDCYFIKAGTIHAIGAGILILEVQQSSNATYRVYDYGRVDKDGNKRELHIDKALDVSELNPIVLNKLGRNVDKQDGYEHRELIRSNYFSVDAYTIETKYEGYVDDSSYQTITFIQGNGKVKTCNQELDFQKGDGFFLGANTKEYTIEGNCKCIITVS